MSSKNRRTFLQQSTAGVTAAATWSLSRAAVSAAGANERIQVGVIGPGGMGSRHVRELAKRKDVRVAYVCDPDSRRVAAAADTVLKQTGQKATAVKDLRHVLDDKNVDAVWIATPDHWHGPATVLACDAGKHVYVEKPCAHNIHEGRLMIEAARRNKRVVQVGTQSRSTEHVMKAMQVLKEGIIGEILVAKAWNSQRRASIGHRQPSDPPDYLDFDLWLGVAPERPYQANLLPSIWRWWFDFGVGDIGNDGVHDIDIARWGLGVTTHPNTVTALGGKFFFDDDQQWPDTQYAVFEYAADETGGRKKQLIYEQRIWSPYHQEGFENGNAFYGTKGMMILGKMGGWHVVLEHDKPGPSMQGSFSLLDHHQDFLDCIRAGGRPHADVEIGHLSASLCHLANIATRTGSIVRFDPKTETVIDNPAAAKMVRRTYRPGHWAIPK